MRKILSILIILMMLFNSMGYLVVFKSAQYSIRKEIKRKLKNSVPENELHVIAVAVSDKMHQKEFTWIHSREFRYRGSMYDIVKSEMRNDTVFYYCINDTEEALLFAGLDEMVSSHHEQSPATQKNAQKLVKNIIREALPQKPEYMVMFMASSLLFRETCSFYPEPVFDIPSPPPEV